MPSIPDPKAKPQIPHMPSTHRPDRTLTDREPRQPYNKQSLCHCLKALPEIPRGAQPLCQAMSVCTDLLYLFLLVGFVAELRTLSYRARTPKAKALMMQGLSFYPCRFHAYHILGSVDPGPLNPPNLLEKCTGTEIPNPSLSWFRAWGLGLRNSKNQGSSIGD